MSRVINQLELIHSFDWDFLIVLDAARADYFQEENWISGHYKTVTSPASMTIVWLSTVFPGFYDITFYASTPYVHAKLWNARKHFRKVVDVWDFGWDDQLCTVPPWNVYEAAKEADSKSLIWFMQPHLPAIGRKKLAPKWSKQKFEHGGLGDIVVIEQLKRGEITAEDVRLGYRENLKLVLVYVEKLIRELDGKIVVTSDHGEFLGENGHWLHPNIDHEVLRKVPWLEVL